ncbi:MAG: DNA recombination protein RmuC [Pseudomonadota bacterium]
MWQLAIPGPENLAWLGAGFVLGMIVFLVINRLGFLRFEKEMKNLSAQALQANSSQFLDLADRFFAAYVNDAKKNLDIKGDEIIRSVDPVRQALETYETRLGLMEREREKAFGALGAHLMEMARGQQSLQKETGNLVKALRVPHVRGRWGELTLRRVAELAGMVDQCDFTEQAVSGSGKGLLRPDMVVHLPGGRNIIVDSKVPLAAYLDSLEAGTPQERRELLENHARQVQTHIAALSSKKYWERFQPTPEFVVLFIPGENYFSAALAHKPDLIEAAIEKGVVVATPTTLISLLKAVAYGWRQEKSAENAEVICQLGTELFQRLASVAEMMNHLGRDIERCAATYNKTIGSLENRVMVSARKLASLGAAGGSDSGIPGMEPAETNSRSFTPQN